MKYNYYYYDFIPLFSLFYWLGNSDTKNRVDTDLENR